MAKVELTCEPMPERRVAFPSPERFGREVPCLLVYDDDGLPVDAVFGADIQPYVEWAGRNLPAADKIVASASHTLAGTALTDAPSGVPMSGGAEPAGAAKPHE